MVTGAGLLALRDFVSFLRYGSSESGNPCAGDIDYAFAHGRSQTGSLLRHILYLGLTNDTHGRVVFDGLMSVAAGGGRGEMNQRFGQPGAGPKHTTGRTFPFADSVQTDPKTGESDGLLARLENEGKTPKVSFINTASEYWRGDAALIHVAPDGSCDLQISDNVRIYHYASTQHSITPLLWSNEDPKNGRKISRQIMNILDYRPLLRAALENLDRWVVMGETPPPSCHPRLDNNTAVSPEDMKAIYENIPDIKEFPAYLHLAHRMDFGMDKARGILTTLPPRIGCPYPMLVSAVDKDGNEAAGIQLPEVKVPLATCTGWNVRHPHTGGDGQLLTLWGATIPFPLSREERIHSGDTRRSINERYNSRRDYLNRIRIAAHALVKEKHLLNEDIHTVVTLAAKH